MGLALDEPEEDDEVYLINEIKVAIDPSIEYETKKLVLDVNKHTGELFLSGANRNQC